MGQPAKVDVEAPVPLKRSPTLRTRDTVGLRDALLARKAKKLQATRLGFLFLYITILFGVWILALRHNRISLYELEYSPSRPVSRPLGVVLKGCDLVVKRGPDARVRLKTHLSSAASASIQMRSGKLERITATNSFPGGCDESPGQRCAPICKLTVELPSSKEIIEEMVAAVMEQVGLSTTQIILFVACVTIAVCALFAFIFLAIGAWHDADGAFIAVVQSTFIAGSGFVTQMAAARKSSDDDTEKAEEMAEESLKDD